MNDFILVLVNNMHKLLLFRKNEIEKHLLMLNVSILLN